MTNLKTIKLDNWQKGFFTQADASYIALKLLMKYPIIAKILVNRFPFIIIDEAQDTSEIQMAIIDNLLLNGLKNLMMVGDPDQAIFEWNNADPKLFKAKYEQWKDNSTILNENRRSSQVICNFTYKLSSLPKPSCAIASELSAISLSPIICSYEDDKVDDIIANFKGVCAENSISITPENVAILYRGNSFSSILTKEPTFDPSLSPWLEGYYLTRDIIKGKFYFDNINSKQGFDLIKKSYIITHYRQNSCSDPLVSKAYEEIGYRNLVKEVYKLISIMPDTKGVTLSQWVQSYNTISELVCFQKLKINVSNGTLPLSSYFANDKVKIRFPDMTVGTIHSVKGETFEAVLIFLKQRPNSGAYYRTLISTGSFSDSEEMRIVYVGMTRPRRLLILAVPEKDNAAWSSLA
jgi:superfamily I DNA/RNA helicase